MRIPQRLWLLLLLNCLLLTAVAAVADDGAWKPLFNGKDLEGWELVGAKEGSWQVVDGELTTTGQGAGWLSTTGQYRNFELELEFRVPENGNSGVFLRAPREGNAAFAGLEIQVLDDYGDKYKELKPYQYCGSLYATVAAEPRVSKRAGEWQTMRIVCEGRHVEVTLNGTRVVDANLDDHQDKLSGHPGLARNEGYVGLQNHSTPLAYRNIRIKPLP